MRLISFLSVCLLLITLWSLTEARKVSHKKKHSSPSASACLSQADSPNKHLRHVNSPNCGGNLATIMRAPNDITNCSLVHLNNQNGYMFNVSFLDVCQDRSASKNGLSKSAYYTPTRIIFFTTGTGSFVHAIDNLAGTSFHYASIPQDISYILDVFTTDTNFYILTVDSLYTSVIDDSQGLHDLTLVGKIQGGFTEDAISASGGGRLFVFDSNKLSIISLSDASITSSYVVSGIGRPMDLQYRHTSSLIILDSYQLFELPLDKTNGTPLTNAVNFLVKIPDGPGFPSTNDLFLDLFFFADFRNVYNIDLSYNNTISSPSPFNGYYSQGNFHYFF